jgi:hypothetical protein
MQIHSKRKSVERNKQVSRKAKITVQKHIIQSCIFVLNLLTLFEINTQNMDGIKEP